MMEGQNVGVARTKLVWQRPSLPYDILHPWLRVMLRGINPWVQDFIQAAEMPEDMVQHLQLVISADARPADQHPRRYNRP